VIDMPAESEKQRKAAGAALAVKRGRGKKKPGEPSENMAQMPEKDLEDFASKKSFDEAWSILRKVKDRSDPGAGGKPSNRHHWCPMCEDWETDEEYEERHGDKS